MTIKFLSLADSRLAYQRQVGDKAKPEVVFLSGFASDMASTKATFLAERCAAANITYTRFDYRGCGKSDGKMADGTIGIWLEDSLAILDQITTDPVVLVGSSMGGWLAILVARARAARVKALVGVAAAPDFTEDLIWEKLTKAQYTDLLRDKKICKEGAPTDRPPITLAMIEEARAYLVLRKPLTLSCPVRLLQGMRDDEVPYTYAERILEHIGHKDVRMTLVKDGNHRLSQPTDLTLLWQTIGEFL